MCCCFRQHGRECISDEMTVEQRREGRKGVSLVDIRQFEKNSPGRGNRTCKGPEVGVSMVGVLWKQPGGRGPECRE